MDEYLISIIGLIVTVTIPILRFGKSLISTLSQLLTRLDNIEVCITEIKDTIKDFETTRLAVERHDEAIGDLRCRVDKLETKDHIKVGGTK